MRSKYSTILFDFDGTIADSLPLWVSGFQHALSCFEHHLDEEGVIATCFYKSTDEILAHFALPSRSEFQGHLQEGLVRAFNRVSLFPAIVEVLDHCRKSGLKTGIVTSSYRHLVRPSLDRTGIAAYFDLIVTAEDVANLKPHPEPVLMAIEKLGGSPASTLMIGDSHADVQAGKAAGTATALFLPQAHSRFYCFETLRSHGPDITFDAHDHLLDHLAAGKTAPSDS